MSRYVELDMEFLGLQMPRVGFLITQNPNEVLDPEHEARLPTIVVWNLVKLGYQVFLIKYNINVFRILKAQMELILCCFLRCVFTITLMQCQLW